MTVPFPHHRPCRLDISAEVRTTFTGISETIGQEISPLKSKSNTAGAGTPGLSERSFSGAPLVNIGTVR